MRRLILPLLAVLGACHAPASKPVAITPYQPPSWLMPETIAVIETLSQKCPLSHFVNIKVAPVNDRWGESWFDDKTGVFNITLNPNAEGPDGYVNTIIHEWAHCMNSCECEDPHCDHWGVCFAQCYRAVIEP